MKTYKVTFTKIVAEEDEIEAESRAEAMNIAIEKHFPYAWNSLDFDEVKVEDITYKN